MSWNHRVVRMNDVSSESGKTLIVCEVYYDDDGKPDLRNAGAIASGDDIEELRFSLNWLLRALEKPILDDDIFEKPE